MIINRDNLKQVSDVHIAKFNKAMAESPYQAEFEKFKYLFMETTSNTRANAYALIETLGKWRKWVGERKFNDVKASLTELVNEDFEKSFKLKASHIEDDQTGVLLPAVENAGADWPALLLSLVFAVINDNPKIADGKPLFSTSRKYGKNDIVNLTTKKLTTAAFEAALTTMSEYKDAADNDLDVEPTHLTVHTSLYATAFGIVGTQKLEGGADNPWNKHVELVKCSKMKPGEWLLTDSRTAMRPVLLQKRKTPKPTMTTNPEQVVETGFAKFMADGRGASAGTVAHLCYKGLGTTD